MKRIICLPIIILFSSLSISAWSQDMAAMMKQQMKDSMSAMCNNGSFLTCTRLNQKKCSSAASKTISSCDYLFPKGDAVMGDDTAFNAHGNCMESQFTKNTGVSASKIEACDPNSGGAPQVSMEQGIAMMGQAFKQHAQSIGTDRVTLPLYKNATITSHLRSHEMGRLYKDVENLSALKMESPDGVKKIASYYRSKLKDYKEYNLQGGIIFMKNGPKDLDLVRDMKKYVSTPHVEIMPIQGAANGLQGSKSEIQISYKE